MENIQINKKEKTKKILSIVFNVLFYIFILLLLIVAISSIKAKKVGGIPNVFGYGLFVVESDSMDGKEPDSFAKDDLIICKMATTKAINNLKIGDIVVFYDINEQKNIAHRIVDLSEGNDGRTYVVTQGDKTALLYPQDKYDATVVGTEKDTNTYNNIETNRASDILAVYVSCNSGAGKTIRFLQSAKGFGLCIVLPTALLVCFEVFTLVRSIMSMNKEKLAAQYAEESESQKAALEEEKKRIREELLAELKKEQEEKNK